VCVCVCGCTREASLALASLRGVCIGPGAHHCPLFRHRCRLPVLRELPLEDRQVGLGASDRLSARRVHERPHPFLFLGRVRVHLIDRRMLRALVLRQGVRAALSSSASSSPASAGAPAADAGAGAAPTRVLPVVAARSPFAVAVEVGKTYAWCSCGLSAKQVSVSALPCASFSPLAHHPLCFGRSSCISGSQSTRVIATAHR
jgi:hypothetical protein